MVSPQNAPSRYERSLVLAETNLFEGAYRWRLCIEVEGLRAELRTWRAADAVCSPVSLSLVLSRYRESVDRVEHGGHFRPELFDVSDQLLEHIKMIIRSPKRRLVRERKMLRPHLLRNMDANCRRWYARQPGSTPIEKAGRKQRLKGVVRTLSTDTTENRLAMLLLQRLRPMLRTLKSNTERYDSDAISSSLALSRLIKQWMDDPDFNELRAAEPLQPTFALLKDIHYHPLWRVWLWFKRDQERADVLWQDLDTSVAELALLASLIELIDQGWSLFDRIERISAFTSVERESLQTQRAEHCLVRPMLGSNVFLAIQARPSMINHQINRLPKVSITLRLSFNEEGPPLSSNVTYQFEEGSLSNNLKRVGRVVSQRLESVCLPSNIGFMVKTNAPIRWAASTVVDHCSLTGALISGQRLINLPYRLGLESGEALDPIYRIDQLTGEPPICGKVDQWDTLLNEGADSHQAAHFLIAAPNFTELDYRERAYVVPDTLGPRAQSALYDVANEQSKPWLIPRSIAALLSFDLWTKGNLVTSHLVNGEEWSLVLCLGGPRATLSIVRPRLHMGDESADAYLYWERVRASRELKWTLSDLVCQLSDIEAADERSLSWAINSLSNEDQLLALPDGIKDLRSESAQHIIHRAAENLAHLLLEQLSSLAPPGEQVDQERIVWDTLWIEGIPSALRSLEVLLIKRLGKQGHLKRVKPIHKSPALGADSFLTRLSQRKHTWFDYLPQVDIEVNKDKIKEWKTIISPESRVGPQETLIIQDVTDLQIKKCGPGTIVNLRARINLEVVPYAAKWLLEKGSRRDEGIKIRAGWSVGGAELELMCAPIERDSDLLQQRFSWRQLTESDGAQVKNIWPQLALSSWELSDQNILIKEWAELKSLVGQKRADLSSLKERVKAIATSFPSKMKIIDEKSMTEEVMNIIQEQVVLMSWIYKLELSEKTKPSKAEKRERHRWKSVIDAIDSTQKSCYKWRSALMRCSELSASDIMSQRRGSHTVLTSEQLLIIGPALRRIDTSEGAKILVDLILERAEIKIKSPDEKIREVCSALAEGLLCGDVSSWLTDELNEHITDYLITSGDALAGRGSKSHAWVELIAAFYGLLRGRKRREESRGPQSDWSCRCIDKIISWSDQVDESVKTRNRTLSIGEDINPWDGLIGLFRGVQEVNLSAI